MVMESPAADKVAIDDAGVVNKDTAADFEIEFAFANSGHFSALDAAGISGDFYTVTYAGYGFIFLKEVAGNSNEVFVVPDVFRGTAA